MKKLQRASGPKIVIVGGGSTNWCPTLLCDLAHVPELEGSEIVLLDPDRDAADLIQALFERICRDNGKTFACRVARNEEDAFTGADFVLITISTGGLEMMQHDLAIPDKYGIYQTVGDTVGPGGWSRLLRNIPVFTAMVQKIERLAPRAIVLNYTNPMAGLTGALFQASRLRCVGLCHGIVGTKHYISRIFGVEMNDLSLRFAGVNHLFWITDFTVRGCPGYPALKERLGGGSLLRFDKASKDPMGFSDYNHRVFSELYEQFGLLGHSADRHTCEFFTRYLTNPATLKSYKLVRTTIKQRKEMNRESKAQAKRMAAGKEPMMPPSSETAAQILKAVIRNEPFFDTVNLPNTGQVENLPLGAVVETPGMVDGGGFLPLAMGTLPVAVRQATEVHCHVQMMTLEASVTGNRKLALQALELDPLCAHLSPSQIARMGGELLEATAAYLPQFKTSGAKGKTGTPIRRPTGKNNYSTSPKTRQQ